MSWKDPICKRLKQSPFIPPYTIKRLILTRILTHQKRIDPVCVARIFRLLYIWGTCPVVLMQIWKYQVFFVKTFSSLFLANFDTCTYYQKKFLIKNRKWYSWSYFWIGTYIKQTWQKFKFSRHFGTHGVAWKLKKRLFFVLI